MRKRFSGDHKWRLSILNPQSTGDGKRSIFKIEKRTFDKNWKTVSAEKISHPTIHTINYNFTAGNISKEVARKNLEELVDQLYRDAKAFTAIVHNSDNRKLLEQYWKSEYEDQNRDLVDLKTALYELERAVEAVGVLSLYSASKKELQDHINKSFVGNKQRRIIAKLNLLLRFAKRFDIKLIKARKEKKRVKHLSRSEFDVFLNALQKILDGNKLAEAIICLHQVCFFTGCRIGEAFSLSEHNFNEAASEIKILTQIDKSGIERDTKNRVDRMAIVFPDGVKPLKAWFSIKNDIPANVRIKMARITKQACQLAFPKNPDKHLKFHDMRHSYAIAMLSKGVSLDLVAQMIGDSIVTCKEYYIGSHISQDSLELVRSKIIG